MQNTIIPIKRATEIKDNNQKLSFCNKDTVSKSSNNTVKMQNISIELYRQKYKEFKTTEEQYEFEYLRLKSSRAKIK